MGNNHDISNKVGCYSSCNMFEYSVKYVWWGYHQQGQNHFGQQVGPIVNCNYHENQKSLQCTQTDHSQ